jgi:hypothetical protein
MAPFLGPSFEEANLVGVSGKAMQVTVPPAGTALREKFGREASEGHCFGLRPLGYMQGSICRAKSRKCERGSLEFNKSLANHGLAGVPLEGSESHHLKSTMCECRSMHINAYGEMLRLNLQCEPPAKTGGPKGIEANYSQPRYAASRGGSDTGAMVR